MASTGRLDLTRGMGTEEGLAEGESVYLTCKLPLVCSPR